MTAPGLDPPLSTPEASSPSKKPRRTKATHLDLGGTGRRNWARRAVVPMIVSAKLAKEAMELRYPWMFPETGNLYKKPEIDRLMMLWAKIPIYAPAHSVLEKIYKKTDRATFLCTWISYPNLREWSGWLADNTAIRMVAILERHGAVKVRLRWRKDARAKDDPGWHWAPKEPRRTAGRRLNFLNEYELCWPEWLFPPDLVVPPPPPGTALRGYAPPLPPAAPPPPPATSSSRGAAAPSTSSTPPASSGDEPLDEDDEPLDDEDDEEDIAAAVAEFNKLAAERLESARMDELELVAAGVAPGEAAQLAGTTTAIPPASKADWPATPPPRPTTPASSPIPVASSSAAAASSAELAEEKATIERSALAQLLVLYPDVFTGPTLSRKFFAAVLAAKETKTGEAPSLAKRLMGLEDAATSGLGGMDLWRYALACVKRVDDGRSPSADVWRIKERAEQQLEALRQRGLQEPRPP